MFYVWTESLNGPEMAMTGQQILSVCLSLPRTELQSITYHQAQLFLCLFYFIFWGSNSGLHAHKTVTEFSPQTQPWIL